MAMNAVPLSGLHARVTERACLVAPASVPGVVLDTSRDPCRAVARHTETESAPHPSAAVAAAGTATDGESPSDLARARESVGSLAPVAPWAPAPSSAVRRLAQRFSSKRLAPRPSCAT